jgi:hypothetical protein
LVTTLPSNLPPRGVQRFALPAPGLSNGEAVLQGYGLTEYSFYYNGQKCDFCGCPLGEWGYLGLERPRGDPDLE